VSKDQLKDYSEWMKMFGSVWLIVKLKANKIANFNLTLSLLLKLNMKVTLHTLLFSTLALFTLAEEMKFGYNLPPQQNICFLQNIAENI